jgi:hypothetical protein
MIKRFSAIQTEKSSQVNPENGVGELVGVAAALPRTITKSGLARASIVCYKLLQPEAGVVQW